MALADVAHRRYTVTVDFGLGAKVGTIMFVIPSQKMVAEDLAAAPDDWSRALEKAVYASQAEISAVLCALKMSVSDVASLSAGDLLPLQGASLDGVTLFAKDGRRVSGARLGRSGAQRAVRLHLDAPVKLKSVAESLTLPNAPVVPRPGAPDSHTEAPIGGTLVQSANAKSTAIGSIEPVKVAASEAKSG